jgi:hypothetical protein
MDKAEISYAAAVRKSRYYYRLWLKHHHDADWFAMRKYSDIAKAKQVDALEKKLIKIQAKLDKSNAGG